MTNFFSLLGVTYHYMGDYAWLNNVYKNLPVILYIILALVGGAGAVYAVILGINLARADGDDARKKAVSRLTNTLIGIAVLLFLVLFINELLPLILRAALGKDMVMKPEEYSDAGNAVNMIKPFLSMLRR